MENTIYDLKNPVRSYFRLSIPVVCGMIVTLIYNLADTYFVGKTGNMELVAGVSLCAPVFTILMAFGNIFGQGGNSLIARLFGEKKFKAIRGVSSFCFWISLFCGTLILAAGFLFSSGILQILGADLSTWSYAQSYLRWICLGAPLIVFSFVPNNLLRTEGLVMESMMGTITGSIVNIVLDPIFIFRLNMGAAGAAIATVLGYVFTDLYFVFILLKKTRYLTLSFGALHASGKEIIQIFGIGFSAALTNILQSLCIIFLNQSLLSYGTQAIAAMGIVQKVIMIVQLVLTGFAFGGAPLYGYLYGAQHLDILRKLIRFCLVWMCGLAAGLGLPLLLFPEAFLRIFIQIPDVLEAGRAMLVWQCAGLPGAAFVLFFNVLFQACGNMTASYLLALSRQGILFLAVLLIARTVLGYTGILASQAIADWLSFVLTVILYRFSFSESRAGASTDSVQSHP